MLTLIIIGVTIGYLLIGVSTVKTLDQFEDGLFTRNGNHISVYATTMIIMCWPIAWVTAAALGIGCAWGWLVELACRERKN